MAVGPMYYGQSPMFYLRLTEERSMREVRQMVLATSPKPYIRIVPQPK